MGRAGQERLACESGRTLACGSGRSALVGVIVGYVAVCHKSGSFVAFLCPKDLVLVWVSFSAE